METALFLGKFWGWTSIIIGLIFIFRKKSLLVELFSISENKSFVLVSGYIALILGVITIILHNVWVADWRVIITIFGWLSFIKGIIRIGFPKIMHIIISFLKKRPKLIQTLLIIMIFLGVWMIW